ncbi:hypothetical protein AC482_04300 [miscellaneous Crenarchaeota group-15 archaeon DG-45]|uniref:Uncharacterized protein n=1 Tax=miscellaneous Crenarchaeota group-15 archaeon DG-45 TaxID=1685127 RepID=A0A0M0BPA3_9ARCH|nr:MAG: hypothetical protein AC482_04300 [miscellaneous Crenarchaeota group-15 archaeon DG-45]
MEERESTKVTWVTCPECGAKIGILISVGRETLPAAPPAAEPATWPPSGMRERLAQAGIDLSLVDVEEGEETIVISPKRFLGDLWGPINEAVRSLGGSWIREGRESRWEIRREDLPSA